MNIKLLLIVLFLFNTDTSVQNPETISNKKIKKVLFVGDSVTAIKNYKNGNRINSTYPNIVEKELKIHGITVSVLAKGGETTIWMLKELENHLKYNTYDRIYLYGGINDAWNKSIKPETTLKNVNKIIDLILLNKAEAYVIQGYNTHDFMDYKKMPVTRYQKSKSDNIELIAEYKKFQDDLFDLQNKRKDFVLISKIAMPKKTSDGIHPNSDGQRMIAEAVLETFDF